MGRYVASYNPRGVVHTPGADRNRDRDSERASRRGMCSEMELTSGIASECSQEIRDTPDRKDTPKRQEARKKSA